MQGALVRSLIGQDDTCHGPRSGKVTRALGRLNPSTTTSERMRYSYQSPCALQLCSEIGGAHTPQLESSPTLQLGRALAVTKTQHSQINKLIKQTNWVRWPFREHSPRANPILLCWKCQDHLQTNCSETAETSGSKTRPRLECN